MAESTNNNTNNVVVNVTGQGGGKSNTPWICGLLGFLLSVPNAICTFVCAAAVGVAAAEAGEEAVGAVAFFAILGTALIPLVCFILSFFGKTRASIVTGILIVLSAIGMFILNIMTFSFLGLVIASLFLVSGISSICNYSRK